MTRGEPQCRPRLLSSCLFKRRRPDCVANYFKLVQSDPKYFKGHCIAAASEGQALGSFQITLEGTHSQYNYINAVHRLH